MPEGFEFCCKGNTAWPALATPHDFQPAGDEVIIADPDTGLALPAYVVGDASSKKGIMLMYDVFGFNGGHVKGVCDELASQGFLVVMPDFYFGGKNPRGGSIEPFYDAGEAKMGKDWLKQFSWDWCGPRVDACVKFMRSKGVAKVGSIGFCWGAWAVARFSADPSVCQAGVWAHPSCQVGHELYGEDDERWLAAQVRAPTLMLPSMHEPDMYRNGSLTEIIEKNGVATETVEFQGMRHGWVTRAAGFLGKSFVAGGGDEADAAVQRGVREAILLSAKFIHKHLEDQLAASA
jgi:dienelactone hydrolase